MPAKDLSYAPGPLAIMQLTQFVVAFSLILHAGAIPGALQQQAVAFVDPRTNGGSMLDNGLHFLSDSRSIS